MGNNIIDFKVLSTVDKRLFNYTNVNTAVGKSAQIHFSSVRDSCLSFINMCFKNDIVNNQKARNNHVFHVNLMCIDVCVS